MYVAGNCPKCHLDVGGTRYGLAMAVDLPPDEPSRSNNPEVTLVGHTRFSLYQPGSTAWQASNKSKFRTPAEYQRYLYSAARLDARVDIFLSMTLPQLALAAEGWNVRHIVSFSDSLPGTYQQLLEDAAGQYRWLVLDRCGLGERPLSPLDLASAGIVGSYRLDDDDILPADYFDRVAPYVTQQHVGMHVSLAAGITAIYTDGELYFARRAYEPMLAIGFLSIHRKHPDGTVVCPPPASHNRSDRAAPVILDSRKPGYMWVRHLEQDTTVHATHLSREQRLEVIMPRMRERQPAADRAEFARYFPAVAHRIHAAARPGEVLEAPVTDLTLIPPDGLDLEMEPMQGRVSITAKLRSDASAIPRNALLAFQLAGPDGAPVGEERADELRPIGFSYSKSVGYYRYLDTRPGRTESAMVLALPEGILLTGVTARRWHRRETSIYLEELVLLSKL